MSSAPAHEDDAARGASSVSHTGADAKVRSRARRESLRPDPVLGATLAGKYQVLELLGEGAMGRVYRAKQIALDKEIAVKVLHRHLTGTERIEMRFHREARAASRLSHPNSLHIHDFGTTDDGTLYIAMELLDGEDLQTILDHDHPLSPARIAALLVPVLRALEEAHRAGIIHRDLKPENVVVQPDRSGREHVKVCDFGIAKILDQDEGHAITVDGFVCGTPQYMAPEQSRGDVIDHRSDLYAAGVVLYQMICGVVPFAGENALGVLTRHLVEAPIPPSERRHELGVPPALEAICLRALQKDPGDRWQSAADMADAVERAVRELGTDADARLGEGPFRPTAAKPAPKKSEAPPPNEPVATRASALPRTWMMMAPALIAAIALVAVLGSRGSEDAPRAPREAAATPAQVSVAAPPTTAIEAPSIEPARTDDPRLDETTHETPAPVSPPPPRARRERATTSAIVDTGEPAAASVEVAPAEPSRTIAEIAFEEGRRRFLANDVPGAIARFEEAARAAPSDADVQKQLGRVYMRAGDVARSIAAYRRYLELAPDAADRAVVERIIAQQGG
ncbi:serine/threonine-protein kinase [Sandaracinus amylolyticus]|uniref:non-specific serine/threonine protein kinase n=1 Tax=Sandaracinus amylolyticus TaxID=927083 RepID=A0A0F6W2J1_9BACT|nr:serine/threonine-protein kinase [Sandaracinus amylolyticus]AKF05615.1 serine/threonine protein kinase [Sandaracinus amylolyticus]